MSHRCFILMTVFFLSIFVTIGSAEKKAEGGATIKGEVLDTTPEQNPIPKVLVTVVNTAKNKEYTAHTNKDGEYEITGLPAGRYTIAVSKDGYFERVGKPKVVAEGGEIYDRIKMRKKGNVLTLYRDIFVACVLSYMLFFSTISPAG